ncbi:hypothetical protein NX059_007963 [Plenodomus lindquistii]|nr:hypothetical protein NX059_007963 [Plenodomus lindquistii]
MAPKTATTSRWTEEELSFVLNYVDECVQDRKDFKDSIEAALLANSGRVITSAGIYNKISKYLRMCTPKVTYPEFLRDGVRCLDPNVLPDSLLAVMRQQRPPRLGDLRLRDIVEPARRMEHAPSGERKRNQMSYREESVPDSNVSNEDPDDADYVNGTPDIDSITPSASTAATVLQVNKHRNDRAPKGADIDPNVARSKTAGKRKAPTQEVIELDDESNAERPPKRASYERTTSVVSELSEAHGVPEEPPHSPPQSVHISDKSGPVRVALTSVSHAQAQFWGNDSLAAIVSRQHQSDIECLQTQINHLSSLVTFKMKRDLMREELADEDIQSVLEDISAAAKEEPGKLVRNLIIHAKYSRAAKDDYLEILRGAFRRHEPGTTLNFPPVPSEQDVTSGWQNFRRGIKEAFTNQSGFSVPGPALGAVSAGYITCTINHLLEDPRPRSNLIPSLEDDLRSPHAAQALSSALLCRWVFANPDWMCEGHHNEPQLGQYKTIAMSDGLSEVQRLDKIAFSSFFAKESFQKTTLLTVIEKLIKRLIVVKQACPDAPGIEYVRRKTEWAEGIFVLKQLLMISPYDYRVHFCRPGTPFDPSWMIAEDFEGEIVRPEKLGSMMVRMCLSPALVQQDPREFKEGQPMEDALIMNKNFFPSWQDRKTFDAKKVIGKATVLVT